MRKKMRKVWGKVRKLDPNLRKKWGKWNSCTPGTVRLATALVSRGIFSQKRELFSEENKIWGKRWVIEKLWPTFYANISFGKLWRQSGKKKTKKLSTKCCEKRVVLRKFVEKWLLFIQLRGLLGECALKKEGGNLATVCQLLIFSECIPGWFSHAYFSRVYWSHLSRTIQNLYISMNHEVILRLELSSPLSVKPKPYRCCFYVSHEICGIGPRGVVVCGLVYHWAEVEISSQTFLTGPEKLSRHIPGWRCVKAYNQPGVSTPPASHFMISAK